MDYTAFEKYPLQITGINDDYNEELTSIENEIISDMEYSGDVSDIESVLPYFVFYAFCESKQSSVDVLAGEQTKVSEFSVPDFRAQIRVWNMAVSKLNVICTDKVQTVKEKYLSPISLF